MPRWEDEASSRSLTCWKLELWKRARLSNFFFLRGFFRGSKMHFHVTINRDVLCHGTKLRGSLRGKIQRIWQKPWFQVTCETAAKPPLDANRGYSEISSFSLSSHTASLTRDFFTRLALLLTRPRSRTRQLFNIHTVADWRTLLATLKKKKEMNDTARNILLPRRNKKMHFRLLATRLESLMATPVG